MVGGVEVGVCQVVGIGSRVAGRLLGGGHGIESQVAFNLVGGMEFLAAVGAVEPAAESLALSHGHLVGTEGEGLDGLLALHFLSTDDAAVRVVVGQRERGIQGRNLVGCQGADGHVGAVGHARDGQCGGVALIVEHVNIATVVLPAGGRVGRLRGHDIALAVGHGDG